MFECGDAPLEAACRSRSGYVAPIALARGWPHRAEPRPPPRRSRAGPRRRNRQRNSFVSKATMRRAFSPVSGAPADVCTDTVVLPASVFSAMR